MINVLKVPISECWNRTGKNPTPVKWIDVNKGDEAAPNCRSRLGTKEIKRDKKVDLFAAMPPPESLRFF